MNMFHSERKNISSDDDDYELPSLSERVQTALKCRSILPLVLTSDSEMKENKVPEISHSTQHSETKFKPYVVTSDSEDSIEEQLKSKFSSPKKQRPRKSSKNKRAISRDPQMFNQISKPLFKTKNLNVNNETDSEEEFSNILENISKIKTPLALNKVKCHVQKELIEEKKLLHSNKLTNSIFRPLTQNRENFDMNKETDSEDEFSSILSNASKFQTPVAPNRFQSPQNKKNYMNYETDSDEEFSKILMNVSKFQTPVTQNKKNHSENDEIDSEEEFANIFMNVSNFQTPVAQNKRIYCKENESDSDGAFSNIIQNLSELHIPTSQKKNNKKGSSSMFSTKYLDDSFKESQADAASVKPSSIYKEREKEYAKLFPEKSTHLSFRDQEMYGRKLYKFFNETIFDSQLPKDMVLTWSNALLTTAGVTSCKRKNGVHSCSIKLSAKLLISFENLQDTLLHEMCHAAVFLISKANEKHGPLWNSWASRCNLILPFVKCPKRCHNYEISYRIWYQCFNCNWKVGRCKQSKRGQHAVCRKCKKPITVTKV